MAGKRNLNSESCGIHTCVYSPDVFWPWNWGWSHVLHNRDHLCYQKNPPCLYGNPKSHMKMFWQTQTLKMRCPDLCRRCRRTGGQTPSFWYCRTHSSAAPCHSLSHLHDFLHCFHHWQSLLAQIEVWGQILTQTFLSWAHLLERELERVREKKKPTYQMLPGCGWKRFPGHVEGAKLPH